MIMIMSKWIKDNNNALTKTKPQAKYYNKYTTSGLCHHLHSSRDWGALSVIVENQHLSEKYRATFLKETPLFIL